MMTRSELVQRRKKYDREKYDPRFGYSIAFAAVVIAWLLLGGIAISSISSWFSLDIPESQKSSVWFVVLLALFFFVGRPLVSWDERKRARQAGLTCPSCGAMLVGNLGDIAVASGRCGRCGVSVLASHDNSGDAKAGQGVA